MNRSDSDHPRSSSSRFRVLLAGAGILALLFIGGWMEREGWMPKSSFRKSDGSSKKELMLLREGAIVYELELAAEDAVRLEEQRAEAIRFNWLNVDEADFYSARLRVGDETVSAHVALFGDDSAYWSGDKWSLFVRLDSPLSGLDVQEFTLNAPPAHGLADDLYQAAALESAGFLSRRPELAYLRVNGEDAGLVVAASTLPRNKANTDSTKSAPLIRFSRTPASVTPPTSREDVAADIRSAASADNLLTANIEAIEPRGGGASTINSETVLRARTLLDGFRRGELTTSEVFDRRKLAHFLALTDLLGTTPSANWRNLSFRYNPVLARLEPTGFSVGPLGIRPTRALAASLSEAPLTSQPLIDPRDRLWFERLFADKEFYLDFVAALSEQCADSEFDEFIDRGKTVLARSLPLLKVEYTQAKAPTKTIKANRRFLNSLLDPKQTVRAHLVYVDQLQASLAVGNLLNLPVEVFELDLGKDTDASVIGGPVQLEGREPGHALEFTIVNFDCPDRDWGKKQRANLKVRTRVLGSTKSNRDPVIPSPPLSYTAAVVRSPSPNFDKFSFLKVDEAERTLTLDADLCAFDRDLVIPEGWTLIALPGTTIDLQARTAIITNSPIQFTGTANRPIRIKSVDNTGQGICVIDAAGLSTMKHVEVVGLQSIDRQGWQMTGAITFYRSEFQLSNCKFNALACEDALNAANTKFRIENCRFEGVYSDAVDSDYCEGEIVSSSFIDSQDDAIDLSGSSVELVDLVIDGANDKGISAGEDSRVRVKRLSVSRCKIAIAAKNRSHVTIEGATIQNCEVGLAAYQNNDDSGPGVFIASELEFRETEKPYDIEDDSSLTVDGEEIQ